jgi:hypothetical protein
MVSTSNIATIGTGLPSGSVGCATSLVGGAVVGAGVAGGTVVVGVDVGGAAAVVGAAVVDVAVLDTPDVRGVAVDGDADRTVGSSSTSAVEADAAVVGLS